MKIALFNVTTTVKPGGLETFNWEMAKALALRGHQVHIYGGHGPVRWDLPAGVTVLTFPFVPRQKIPDLGSRFRKFVERLIFGRRAYKTLASENYDYIYLSKPYDIPTALMAARRGRARIVYGSGGTEFFPGYKALVKRIDYFFACSRFNAGQIEKYCGLSPEVLHNGVNTDLFKPLKPDRDLQIRLGLAPQDRVLITACRLVGWKGVQFAVSAAARLIGKGYPLKYLIAGEGPSRKELERQARELNTTDRVVFLGQVPNKDLPALYALAHLAVFPSIGDEAFGISVGEALACGVPVVSTRWGGVPEVVPEGAGFLVPPRDEEALAAAMEKLIADEEMRRMYGLKGREHVLDRFTWPRVARNLENLLAVEKSPDRT